MGVMSKNVRRLFVGGVRRIECLAEASACRLGLVRLDADFTGALMLGADLSRPLEWGKGCRFFIESQRKAVSVEALNRTAPQAASLIIAEADRICNHVFDLLGSGPTPLGEKIDWHTDFKTGHRWNPQTYYKRIRPAPYPGGYDIKVP